MSVRAGLVAAFALVALGGCSSAGVAETRRQSTYRCVDGRAFTVDEGRNGADVRYYGQHFRLPRRTSSIGTRYASPDATLIIDGDMAVLVTENIMDLQSCRALPS